MPTGKSRVIDYSHCIFSIRESDFTLFLNRCDCNQQIIHWLIKWHKLCKWKGLGTGIETKLHEINKLQNKGIINNRIFLYHRFFIYYLIWVANQHQVGLPRGPGFKGHVAWISEKQRLPVKPPERLVFTVRSFTLGGFTTDEREIT